MKEYIYYVYILTKERNSIFYIGVTNDLVRRVYEHKEGFIPRFTKKYGVNILVYYESYDDIYQAIHREKIIKKCKRKFKVDGIEKNNPQWRDSYFDLIYLF